MDGNPVPLQMALICEHDLWITLKIQVVARSKPHWPKSHEYEDYPYAESSPRIRASHPIQTLSHPPSKAQLTAVETAYASATKVEDVMQMQM